MPHPPSFPRVGTPGQDAASELGRRWARARAAALFAILGEASDQEEARAVARAHAQDPQATLRTVFEHSFRLGQGFSRFYRLDLCLPDLRRLLPALSSPCTAEGFVEGAETGVARAVRAPCPEGGAAWCSWWREATLGLVNGLSSSVWFSRVESGGGGGSRCCEVLHVDPWSPARFLTLTDEQRKSLLVSIVAVGSDPHDVDLLGVAEGALYVRFRGSPAAQIPLLVALQRAAPQWDVRDTSPRPVLSPPPARSSPCETRTSRLPILDERSFNASSG